MQLFLENFFASGLSILETEIIERQQLEEDLQKAQEELKQKEMRLAQAQQKLQDIQDFLIQRAEICISEWPYDFRGIVAGLVHEINNPISFINGNLEYAREYIEDLRRIINLYAKHYPQPVAEIQAAIEKADLDFVIEDLPKLVSSMHIALDRIRQIIMTMRNYSRLDGAEMKAVNLHEGIDSTLLMFNNKLRYNSAGIQVIKEYGELPQVECYARQLNLVFMHLLSNAIDALEERVMSEISQPSTNSLENATHYSPTITLRTGVSVDSSHVIIQIADNGPGMTEELRLRLFDPFFTTKPVDRRVGLGLTISHQIVEEKHGGQLKCVSELGKGTEFTIELPIRQQQQQPS